MSLDLIKIRKHLHKHPELSGSESETASFIVSKLHELSPDTIIENIGGNGVAAVFNGNRDGKTVVFRADIDALPIKEINDFEYKSTKENVSHKCGHDGHSTVMLGFAERIAGREGDFEGRIVCLFQPAEETAQGAKAVIEDKKFLDLKPDMIIGWHNLPGFPLGSVILREGTFSSASTGMIIRYFGRTSHAAHPDNGLSPVIAFTSMINAFNILPTITTKFEQPAIVTVVGARLGEKAFGTAPGNAEIFATLRSHSDENMKRMCKKAESYAYGFAETFGLKCEIEYVEYFPANVSSDECVQLFRESAEKADFEIIMQEEPFPWSEDFAYYSQIADAGFYGLGSGVNHPQLHNPDYDFPDELIDYGITMYENLALLLLKT